MDTPRPRSGEDVASPTMKGEVLPPSSPPLAVPEDKRGELEAEMVAVLEKISKASKLLPDNLK